MPDEPKIIVDDDWKKQAKAEKARLSEAEKSAPPKAPRPPAPSGTAPGATPQAGDQTAPQGAPVGDQPLDKIDFSELLRMLGTQALMYLGQFPDPQTGKAIIALDMAKVNIDLLAVLEDKTKGNLTPEEDRDLKGLLGELRMIFVEISRTVAKAMAEGRIGPRGEMRPAGAQGMGPMGPAGPLPPTMSGPGFNPGGPGGPGGFGIA